MALAENCTGEDIIAAIGAEALRRGVSPLDIVRPLSPDPSKWLSQVAVARRPKPATIARVCAVLAGHLVVPIEPRVRCRAASLRAAVAEETAEVEARRRRAQTTGGGVTNILESRGDRPVLAPVITGQDRRPFAHGRDPCPRCNTRGDIGCRHQRPDPELPEFQGLDPP